MALNELLACQPTEIKVKKKLNLVNYFRVGDVTGLNMETSEYLQIGNYGMGGHYTPHTDYSRVSFL